MERNSLWGLRGGGDIWEGLRAKGQGRCSAGGRKVKVHQMRYLDFDKGGDAEWKGKCLAVSTEDGRVIFFSTAKPPSAPGNEGEKEGEETTNAGSSATSSGIPSAQIIGELGNIATATTTSSSSTSRIKDFKIMTRQLLLQHDNNDNSSQHHRQQQQQQPQQPQHHHHHQQQYILITGSSDGSIRLWRLDPKLFSSSPSSVHGSLVEEPRPETQPQPQSQSQASQVGTLLGTYNTSGRITCLEAMMV